MSEVKGFKVFNPDWTCRGFRYEVGQMALAKLSKEANANEPQA